MPHRDLIASAALCICLAPVGAMAQCEVLEYNTNQAYEIGDIHMREPLEFVYSSYNEPVLAYSDMGNGNKEVFRAIQRAINTVESAIRADNSVGKHKEHNLFSLRTTDQPFHPSQVSDTGSFNHWAYVDNNYGSLLYSGDGVSSIGWVDFTANAAAGETFGHEHFGAIVYTVWNDAQEIIERDIMLQANEFNTWVVNEDLTNKTRDQSIECSDLLDVQGVMTHMLAHTVGLRTVTEDGNPANGTEASSTMWDAWPDLTGRVVLSNFGFPTKHWQTLTPGDKLGLAAAAPEKGATFTPPLEVTEDPPQVVLHYDFEQLGGGTVLDQSGNQLDAEVAGVAGQLPGPIGMAIDLSAGQHIDLDGAGFPLEKIPQDDYTMAAWLNIPPAAVANIPVIFDAIGPLGYLSHAHFIFNSGYGLVAWQGAEVSIPIENLVNNPYQPAAIPVGWFHYAVSYDRSAGQAVLYINGTIGGIYSVNDGPLASSWSGGARVGHIFGAMDEFVLTNYALSAGEVNALMGGSLP